MLPQTVLDFHFFTMTLVQHDELRQSVLVVWPPGGLSAWLIPALAFFSETILDVFSGKRLYRLRLRWSYANDGNRCVLKLHRLAASTSYHGAKRQM